MYKIVIAFFIIALIWSCKKTPGEGGMAGIKGKLYSMNVYNRSDSVRSDDGENDTDVYIEYGDNSIPADRVRTSPDGSFEFKYLRKGKYRIYAYSLDTSAVNPSAEVAFYKDVEIKEKKESVEVKDFVVYKPADKNGSCSIKGRLYAKNFNSSFSYVSNSGYMPDVDVYINYGTRDGYHDRVKSDANGYFVFKNLRRGKYKIFAFCKVPVNPTTLEPRTSPNGYLEISYMVSCQDRNKEYLMDDLKVNL